MSSYNLADHMAEIEAKGDVSRGDWYRMLQYHEDKRREREREMENKKYKKQQLYNQIEDEELSQSQKRQQKADLMATSKFNVASIMPKVKSLVADKQFETSGNASQSVIGDSTVSAKGGRRTRSKRSGHKRSGHKRSGHKRSGHKRSGHKKRSNKRSGKRSGRMSRRR
jgi:hypothetical protein